jgi:hypothetical protein
MRRTIFGILLAALALPALPGCFTRKFCCPDPLAPALSNCLDIPCGCRNRVFVFFLTGYESCWSVDGLRDHLNEAGFLKTYVGHPHHVSHFALVMEKLHKCDEHTRFVVVGQGKGAGAAAALAQRVAEMSLAVDLLVFLDRSADASASGEPTLLIHGAKYHVEASKAQRDVCLGDVGWESVAGHPETTRLLLAELAAVAWRVPVIDDLPGAVPMNGKAGPGWEFVCPDGQGSGPCGCIPTPVAGWSQASVGHHP